MSSDKSDKFSLPDGWKVEKVTRSQGTTAGRIDTFYRAPDGKRYRSKVEVRRVLEEIEGGDSTEDNLTPNLEANKNINVTSTGFGMMINDGNVCYAICILHILRYTPHWRRKVHHAVNEINKWKKMDKGNKLSNEMRIVVSLHDVHKQLYTQEISPQGQQSVSVAKFLSVVRKVHNTFTKNNQHDAHEFLLALIHNVNGVLEYLKNTTHSDSSSKKRKIDDVDDDEKLFSGELACRTKCLECEYIKEYSEDFTDIRVAVPSHKEEEFDEDEDVKDFLSHIICRETLRGRDKYPCDVCQHLTEAHRYLGFKDLPPILIMRFARFFVSENGRIDKALSHVEVPLVLPCFCDECRNEPVHDDYVLYGGVMHTGSTISAGHYTSYIRYKISSEDTECQPRGQKKRRTGENGSDIAGEEYSCCMNSPPDILSDEWMICDDENIGLCSSDDILQELSRQKSMLEAHTPYLLFYSNCGFMG